MSPDSLSLQGKVAIITGSGRENGIGAAIARALARNGASVVVNHVSDGSRERAEGVANGIRESGGKAIVIQANVDEAGAKKLVEGAVREFGGIDILSMFFPHSFT
jgi:NAD(P)-dependent dehydrogenase (short-subunit alcohol dehydrogenase family)